MALSPQEIKEYMGRALSPESGGGTDINDDEALYILKVAQESGVSPEQLAELSGTGISGDEVRQFLQQNYPQQAKSYLEGNYGPSQGGGGGATPTGNVVNSNGNNGTPAPQWAAIEQGNVDYRTAIQNSIMNNPNITLADGSTQTTSYGNLPDYESYVRNSPDLYEAFTSDPNSPFTDMAAYGQWHYENLGRNEGRELPTGSPEDLGFLQPDISVNLSPEEQAIYDANQRSRGTLANTAESQLGRVQASFGNEIDPNSFHDQSGYLDQSGWTERTIDPTVGGMESVRDAMVDRYQPLFDRKRDSMKNDLMVQGHNPGGESWQNQFDDLNRQENDFYLGAMENAGQEQQRLFNMEGMQRQSDMSESEMGYNMGTNYRQNQINETLAARNLPLNEYNALMTGTQIQTPNMTPYSGTQFQSPDYAGAAQEQYNRNFVSDQQDQQQKNQLTQGLFQLGGAALGGFGSSGGFQGLFGK